MLGAPSITRRSFLIHAGRGIVAVIVPSMAGCGPSAVASERNDVLLVGHGEPIVEGASAQVAALAAAS
jgi:hypothetical protein